MSALWGGEGWGREGKGLGRSSHWREEAVDWLKCEFIEKCKLNVG